MRKKRAESIKGSTIKSAIAAVGYIFDDEPYHLANALVRDMDRSFPSALKPVMKCKQEAKSRTTVSRWVDDGDFFMVDHRLGGCFVGFDDGYALCKYILERKPEARIFYYSAYPEDFRTSDAYRRGQTRLQYRYEELFSRTNVRYYAKEDLEPSTRLNMLYAEIQSICAAKLFAGAVAGHGEIAQLLEANVLDIATRRYRARRQSPREETVLIEDLNSGYTTSVPMSRIHMTYEDSIQFDIQMTCMEFSTHHVLSILRQVLPGSEEISEEAMSILEGKE